MTAKTKSTPSFRASCAGIPDWVFGARDLPEAEATAAAFTRWSLERAGLAGKHEVRVEGEHGEAANIAVTAL